MTRGPSASGRGIVVIISIPRKLYRWQAISISETAIHRATRGSKLKLSRAVPFEPAVGRRLKIKIIAVPELHGIDSPRPEERPRLPNVLHDQALRAPNGWRVSGEPSEQRERPERSEGRRVRCTRMLGRGSESNPDSIRCAQHSAIHQVNSYP